MGKAIAQLAPERGFDVRLRLDLEENRGAAAINSDSFKDIDVAIDFTAPDAAVENILRVAPLGVNLVVGTTGWHGQLDQVRRAIEASGVGMVYAPNFSIGVQLFYRVARAAAAIFRDFPMYDPYLSEAHHRAKQD